MSGADEVEATLETIFECAAWSDKFDGDVHNVPCAALLVSERTCRDDCRICAAEHALLGLVHMIATTIAVGNRVIVFHQRSIQSLRES